MFGETSLEFGGDASDRFLERLRLRGNSTRLNHVGLFIFQKVDIVAIYRYHVATMKNVTTVGIRDLKNKLSHYLSQVKHGKTLSVTERGKVIAYLTSAEKALDFEKIAELIREDVAFWKGGKPLGSARPAKVSGKPVSEIVIEERR
jgi:prevent-host-death family protein